jgi:hypothetical protein
MPGTSAERNMIFPKMRSFGRNPAREKRTSAMATWTRAGRPAVVTP